MDDSSVFMISLLLQVCLLTVGTGQMHGGNPDHECLRTCEWPPQPRTCVYNFTADWFYSMSVACNDCPINQTHCDNQYCIPLNGVARPIAVVNKMLPGPAIQVCKDDIVQVHVTNHLNTAAGLSIHWHGAHLKGTPYMDGVPMITQCPIDYKTSFTYSFKASPAGTHWWHSHAGVQRSDGLYGQMIFRQAPQADINSALYDYDLPEHVIAVHDWFDVMTFNRYTAHIYGGAGHTADSILINGKGKRQAFHNNHGEMVFTDRESFKVTQGKRYRFRVFSNAITVCPIKISIDNHKLTIIASDGRSLQPYEADAFFINSGERYDFVLDANQDIENYWLRFEGMFDCKGLYELASLNYDGASDSEPPEEKSETAAGQHGNQIVVNGVASEEDINVVELDSAETNDDTSQEGADLIFYLGMDMYQVNKYFVDPGVDASAGGGHGDHKPGGQTGQTNITQAPGNHDGHQPGATTTKSSAGGGHGGHKPDGQTGQTNTTQAPGNHDGHQPGATPTKSSGQDGEHPQGTEKPLMHSMKPTGDQMGHDSVGYTSPTTDGHGDTGGGHDTGGHGGTGGQKTGGDGTGHSAHGTHYLYTAQINHQSSLLPSRPPLTQYDEIPKEELCEIPANSTNTYPMHCKDKYCSCTQIINVNLGQVVDMVLIDEGRDFNMAHPMHFHGYSFRVIAQGKLGTSTTVEEVMRLDQAGNITRKLDKAPLKDTVIVQDGGYTIIRFKAGNPGWWSFHCHVQFHLQAGMSFLVHVGSEQDLPPKPDHLPRCGPWPSDYKEYCFIDTVTPNNGKQRKVKP